MSRPIIVPVVRIAVSTWLLSGSIRQQLGMYVFNISIRQQLSMYVFKPLLGRNWEISFLPVLCASPWVMFLWSLRTISLFETRECKFRWLLEPDDLETYSLGGCHKSCGLKYVVQSPSGRYWWSGFIGVGWREIAWEMSSVCPGLWGRSQPTCWCLLDEKPYPKVVFFKVSR